MLLLELGARDGHGYEAQTGKPIVFGAPPPDYRDMLDVCFEAYHAIVDVLKPGLHREGHPPRRSGDPRPGLHGGSPARARRVQPTRRRARSSARRTGPTRTSPLAPGMGLCVEIHPCSEDVIKGVFLGDTYVITEDGARCVNHLEPEGLPAVTQARRRRDLRARAGRSTACACSRCCGALNDVETARRSSPDGAATTLDHETRTSRLPMCDGARRRRPRRRRPRCHDRLRLVPGRRHGRRAVLDQGRSRAIANCYDDSLLVRAADVPLEGTPAARPARCARRRCTAATSG